MCHLVCQVSFRPGTLFLRCSEQRQALRGTERIIRLPSHEPEGGKEEWCTPHRCHVVNGEAGDTESVEPGGDGNRLLPVRAPHIGRQVRLLHQDTVSDDLIVGRRRHDELRRGFVVGMVHHGKPFASPVGPVLTEHGALAVLVCNEAQSVSRGAAVQDGDGHGLTCLRRRRKADAQPVALVSEFQRRASRGDRRNGHPLAISHACEVEIDFGYAVGDETEVHRRFAFDLVGSIAQTNPENVVHRVDSRLSWIGVGMGDPRGGESQEQS